MGESLPGGARGVELPAPRGGELVKACAPIVLGSAPGSIHPAPRFETAQGRVERAVVDVEHAARDGLDGLRELPTVRGSSPQQLENDEIERALEEIDLALVLGHGALL